MIIYAVVTANIASTATSPIVVGIIVVDGIIVVIVVGCTIVVAKSEMIDYANFHCFDLLVVPSIDSRLDATLKVSFSYPFYACGYQNRACCDTL